MRTTRNRLQIRPSRMLYAALIGAIAGAFPALAMATTITVNQDTSNFTVATAQPVSPLFFRLATQ
jgi:hypothetical protein